MKIQAECRSCSGTGLYSGMCEGEGCAVICIACSGTGCEEIHLKPYTGRKKKRGILRINRSRGGFLATGVGEVGESMSYQEFQKLIPEVEV